jgi:hypothetical protein
VQTFIITQGIAPWRRRGHGRGSWQTVVPPRKIWHLQPAVRPLDCFCSSIFRFFCCFSSKPNIFPKAPRRGSIIGSQNTYHRELDADYEQVHVGGTKKGRGRGQRDRSEEIEEEEQASGKGKRTSTRIGSAGAQNPF